MHAVHDRADAGNTPSTSGSGIGVGVASVAAAAAVTIPLAVIALTAPKFTEVFRDFGVALPVMTRGILRLGGSLASPLGAVVILLIGVGVVGLVCLAWRARRGLGLAALLACVVWFCVSLGVVLVGLLFPLVGMIGSLQQGSAP